jgi:hypothetical protein
LGSTAAPPPAAAASPAAAAAAAAAGAVSACDRPALGTPVGSSDMGRGWVSAGVTPVPLVQRAWGLLVSGGGGCYTQSRDMEAGE